MSALIPLCFPYGFLTRRLGTQRYGRPWLPGCCVAQIAIFPLYTPRLQKGTCRTTSFPKNPSSRRTGPSSSARIVARQLVINVPISPTKHNRLKLPPVRLRFGDEETYSDANVLRMENFSKPAEQVRHTPKAPGSRDPGAFFRCLSPLDLLL